MRPSVRSLLLLRRRLLFLRPVASGSRDAAALAVGESSGSEGSEGNVNSGERAEKYYGDLSRNFLILRQINLFGKCKFYFCGMKSVDLYRAPLSCFLSCYRNFLIMKYISYRS